ncbi:MAG: flavodoxin family protein [Anaerolineae bacterium]|nr:flavodoxin family protein [Anaerolineae bacterium]
MISMFDLRANPDPETLGAITSLYDEPLHYNAIDPSAIKTCIGCWSCWVKTPGMCVCNDAISEIYPGYVNSDKVILLMDTVQGFLNHSAKAFFDRTIPHYHPYIEIVDGECHHKARYERYPEMHFYYDDQNVTVNEAQIIEDYLYRTAYHFQSKAYRIHKNPVVTLKELQPRCARNKVLQPNATQKVEKLVLYNGSPRLQGSNTTLILEAIAKTYGTKVVVRDLKQKRMWAQWAADFPNESAVIFAMPLYVHAMPSHVMAFLEMLQPCSGSLGFIVQQGFPESRQSYFLEAYFENLALRLQREYIGTAIKGGVEGLQYQPAKEQEKMLTPFVELVGSVIESGQMSAPALANLAGKGYLSKGMLFLFKLLAPTGLINAYWDRQLKQNDAFQQRYNQPYAIQTGNR